MDELINCKRCGGNACYEQHLPEEVVTWLCLGCGFSTTTLMTEGSETLVNILNTSHELYKDLKFVDQNGHYWFPSTVTVPDKGMVFVDGTSSTNWGGSGIKVTPIPEEEKSRYPSGQEYKMDTSTKKTFNQKGYMDALQYMGFFDVN